MPQGLGRNLYPDLSVRENIEFFGRLFGQPRAERDRRIARAPRQHRPCAIRRSARQKALRRHAAKAWVCCALIHDPDFLILDEPTTGVDPLSRRQFWDLVVRMRAAVPA